MKKVETYMRDGTPGKEMQGYYALVQLLLNLKQSSLSKDSMRDYLRTLKTIHMK